MIFVKEEKGEKKEKGRRGREKMDEKVKVK